ncbi:RHS repeat domain-containing protein [Pseudomonas triticicola]|uniref:RHS repeat protein n=1 Tax=Pseudomonas triticicola TaxID=2842345 RepID=A0ABS6RQX0_9PSED|nr:RHS repeat-associated core domain-containing protein [Pseudomonas triticicola]MBV4547981.1 RHS repeat protein [Pseudomonas triticicola]
MSVQASSVTPTLSVMDSRRLAVRRVSYYLHPDIPDIEPRITRQVLDGMGREVQSWDPRLWGTAPKPNIETVYSLSAQALLTDSVDAGWQLKLLNDVGSLHLLWDGRGSQRQVEYDDQQRPVAMTEHAADELPKVVERLLYGASIAEHNQCGRLIRHDDPAGSQTIEEYGLAGDVLVDSRRFLIDLEIPDWPVETDAKEEWLETQEFVTRHTVGPTGEAHRQTDAKGNVRRFCYDVSGQLVETWLLRVGGTQQPQLLVGNIRYNGQGRIESETTGNGLTSQARYSAEDGSLIRLVARVGNKKPLLDLNYVYDPVGNVIEQADTSQDVSHFNNQRVEPINRYRYDSLYQLVEARGWEVSQPSHGPGLPALLPLPLDPNQRRNYTRSFDYDRAGNLLARHQNGTPGFSMFTSTLSNRSLAQRDDGSLPGESDVASAFDACGNQRQLQRGQDMIWDCRNQLRMVTLVARGGEADDDECYVYDHPGHRIRKTRIARSSGRTLHCDVRYLPGLEIHRESDGVERHVISIEAGRSQIRALHWPGAPQSDQLRYNLSDHLGSSTLELDHEAGVLTREHYYPFGGTACWAARSSLVAQYKSIRYSGKERDKTGLYYYGYRYYAPWLHRWITADPASDIDGLNVYMFCANNPLTYLDVSGLAKYKGKGDAIEKFRGSMGGVIAARGLKEIKKLSPEKGQRLENNLQLIPKATAEAIRMLKEENVDWVYQNFTSRIFGSHSSPQALREQLLSVLVPLKATADKYAGGRSERLVLAAPGGNLGNTANTHPEDPRKRLFLSDEALDLSPVNLVTTIVHESSHRLNKPTHDFMYYALDFVLTADDPDRSNSIVDRISSGLENKYLAETAMAKLTNDVRKEFFADMDVQAVTEKLNADPGFLQKTLLSNADSYALLVKSMSYPLFKNNNV